MAIDPNDLLALQTIAPALFASQDQQPLADTSDTSSDDNNKQPTQVADATPPVPVQAQATSAPDAAAPAAAPAATTPSFTPPGFVNPFPSADAMFGDQKKAINNYIAQQPQVWQQLAKMYDQYQ